MLRLVFAAAKSVCCRLVATVVVWSLTGGVFAAQPVATAPATAPATTPAGAPATAPASLSMAITNGLAPFQVLQRDDKGMGTIRCAGSIEGGAGRILGRVVMSGKPLDGLDWKPVGETSGKVWSAIIAGIPTGGPYRVELQIEVAGGRSILLEIDGVLVGDLWILAGQSNMQGVGDMVDVESPSPFVHSYEMNERWSVAEEPLHRLTESPDPVHHPGLTPEQIERARKTPRAPLAKGTGMGLPFAKELYNRTKVPIGLVPCAHGGTSMEQWDPARRDQSGSSLYGAMFRRFQAVGGRVKGVLWYQGESDANPVAARAYREKFVRLIESVRHDFGDPALPFYLVQISRVAVPAFDVEAWCAIREAERIIALSVPATAVISAIDLELDDGIHIGTQGLKRLGRRAAMVADRELFGNMKVSAGPRLKTVVLEDGSKGVIRVNFDGVNGRLRPDTHIAGFSLRTVDGKPGPDFWDVRVDPKRPDSVLCLFWGNLPAGCTLWYGYGLNPYCNLVDELDMAVTAFGPISVSPPTTAPASRPASQPAR